MTSKLVPRETLDSRLESKVSLGTSLKINHPTFWPDAQTFLRVIQNSTKLVPRESLDSTYAARIVAIV